MLAISQKSVSKIDGIDVYRCVDVEREVRRGGGGEQATLVAGVIISRERERESWGKRAGAAARQIPSRAFYGGSRIRRERWCYCM